MFIETQCMTLIYKYDFACTFLHHIPKNATLTIYPPSQTNTSPFCSKHLSNSSSLKYTSLTLEKQKESQ